MLHIGIKTDQVTGAKRAIIQCMNKASKGAFSMRLPTEYRHLTVESKHKSSGKSCIAVCIDSMASSVERKGGKHHVCRGCCEQRAAHARQQDTAISPFTEKPCAESPASTAIVKKGVAGRPRG